MLNLKLHRHLPTGYTRRVLQVKSKYEEFIEVTQGEKPMYACRLCEYACEVRRSLICHIRSGHIPQITCPTCGEYFLDKKKLEAHKAKPHSVKYSCTPCDLKFTKKELLANHNKYHHDVVKCTFCKELVLKLKLKQHLLDSHEELVPTCGICGYKGKTQAFIVRHQRKVHMKEKNVKCPDCEFQCFGYNELSKHMIRHKVKKTFGCRFCMKTFPRHTTRKIHEMIHTGSRFKYQDFINVVKGLTTVFACRLCEFKFEKRSSLVHHIRSGHMQQLTCHVCNKIFSDEKLLQAHKSQPHPMKYPCKLCELSFATVAKLKSHKTHHHAKVRCTICPDVLFTNYNNRKTHMFSFHKDLLPTCGVCGLKGMSQNRIDQHQQKVHLKEKNVTCSVCQYQCYGYSQLKRHMIRHKVEKVYSCRFCKKTFPRPTTCRIHEMIHTGEKNKVCELCDAAFVQKASLNYHMIKHHPDHV